MEPSLSPPTIRRSGPHLAACAAAALLSLGAAACADDADLAATDHDAPSLAQVEGDGTTVTVPDPNGTYFADIRANGTGCPQGSWNARISDDGQVFTITFSDYVTSVTPETYLDVRDCQLGIKLRTPANRSFSVQSFSYQGFAMLEPGVSGRQTAYYYFSGRPVEPRDTNRVELYGPYNQEYLFRDEVPLEARVWSECGLDRELQIRTRVQLQNAAPWGTGYMNLSAIDGALEAPGKLELELDTRVCNGNGPVPGNPQPGNPQPGNPQPGNPQPGNPQPSNPGSPLRPTGVSVSPPAITTDQRFTVAWTPISGDPSATYAVQLFTHRSLGGRLIWESPAIIGHALTYNGPRLPNTGTYQVFVVAYSRNQVLRSTPFNLEVRQGGGGGGMNPPPSSTPPSPVLPPDPVRPSEGGFKVSQLRLSTSSVPRDQPFTVSWAPPPGASASTTYRVRIHEHVDRGFALVWESPELRTTSFTYYGPPLPRNDVFHVVVFARDGSRQGTSDPVPLQATNLLRPPPNGR